MALPGPRVWLIGLAREEVRLRPMPVTGPGPHGVLGPAGRQRLGPAAAGPRTVSRARQNRERCAVDQPREHRDASDGRNDPFLARCRCLCSAALIHCDGLRQRGFRWHPGNALSLVTVESNTRCLNPSRPKDSVGFYIDMTVRDDG